MTKQTLTNWYISESTTSVDLDEDGRGEVVFTVKNGSTDADRVVFTVEALDGAAKDWITLPETDGAKTVPAGESVTYLAVVAVPATAPAATYGFQARVYSANADPSETSATSRRITFEKPLPATPTKGDRSMRWPYLAIPVALLVIAVGLWLVLRGGKDDDVATRHDRPVEVPDPVAPDSVVPDSVVSDPMVTVAAVIGKPLAEAQAALEAQQLKVVANENDQSGTPGIVLAQEPAQGGTVAPGDTVTLTVVTYHLKDLVGLTADQATNWLNGKGLTATRTTRTDSSAAGTVFATHPAANAVLNPGDTVALDVSSGPEPDYFVLRTGSSECLEVGGYTPGGPWPEVSARSPCTAVARQQWAYIQVSDDHYLLKNKGNGLCLDVPFNDATDGNRLITADCHGAIWQQWHQGKYANGGNHIVSWSTGKCVDKSGDKVLQWQCHDGWWQYWAFDRV
jgi:hypothetical protein